MQNESIKEHLPFGSYLIVLHILEPDQYICWLILSVDILSQIYHYISISAYCMLSNMHQNTDYLS